MSQSKIVNEVEQQKNIYLTLLSGYIDKSKAISNDDGVDMQQNEFRFYVYFMKYDRSKLAECGGFQKWVYREE